jgi:uncharacterized membrane protein (UPF0127 family)
MNSNSLFAPFVAALGLALLAGSPLSLAQSRLPVVDLTAGMHVVKAEVAARDEDRQQGLMFRQKMGSNEGMLFVFEQPQRVCMWMKNTPLPLSVAFLDGQGRIINIEDMQPQTLESHCAAKPARYALEMNQGWFRQKNIKAGVALGGVPGASSR